MVRFASIGAVLLLAGCGFTPQGDIIREAVAVKGAQAYDEGLANAEWFVCNAASVGSVLRRYGKDKTSADAWNALCQGQREALIVKPVQ